MASAEVEAFIGKWKKSELKERAAAQEHFIDLCKILGHPSPAEADPKGEWYCFEAGAKKLGGGDGWADVWKKGFFAWEYKGKKKDLTAAYLQLNQYREDLENPPLLVVCDTDRFQIHTNFTGTAKKVYEFDLEGLRAPENLQTLKRVFTDPEKLRPGQSAEAVTEEAAAKVARMARSLESRGVAPRSAAHFLMQAIFCLFAEDVGILPKNLFTNLLKAAKDKPESFELLVSQLFGAMKDGGYFGTNEIPWFDGGLFADDTVIALEPGEIQTLYEAAQLDWATVEPAIFGTLFERSLDPEKRTQIGAHYTSPEDIQAILEPVIFAPLRREWEEVKERVQKEIERFDKAKTKKTRDKAQKAAVDHVGRFLERLRAVKVLDPACGSGNFLYLALRGLKDLEGQVIGWAAQHHVGSWIPFISPLQLYGIEVNRYAHELAQVVVWIGHLQWAYQNGFSAHEKPILKAFENIQCADAILGDQAGPMFRPEWPQVDFIVGNPPFLGGKYMRKYLTDGYVDRLFETYEGRVPREADLVCYWFDRAFEKVKEGKAWRVGLVATNSIRGGPNRKVLEKISEDGGIFMAWSDRPWVLDGAAVRVSMVGFDDGSEEARFLDGAPVEEIYPDLTCKLDVTKAKRLKENLGIAFMGDTKGGPFDIPGEKAKEMLDLPNPLGRANRGVVKPWANGLDVTRRPRDMWIIDFGVETTEDEAALYEVPFEYVKEHVKPLRDKNRRKQYRERWWIHVEPRPAMRRALDGLPRFIVTPTVAKHRLFNFLPKEVLADHQLIVFARDDFFTFGVLHSRVHECWSLAMCSWLGVGNDPRYTPTSTFETFPFPKPSPDGQAAVEAAAQALHEARESALAEDPKLTLTSLYNKRPTWLAQRHEALDRAVLAAYGWPEDLPDDDILARLLALNAERHAAGTSSRGT